MSSVVPLQVVQRSGEARCATSGSARAAGGESPCSDRASASIGIDASELVTRVVQATSGDQVHDAVHRVGGRPAVGEPSQADHRCPSVASVAFALADAPGKSPSGAPLPSQLSRLTRPSELAAGSRRRRGVRDAPAPAGRGTSRPRRVRAVRSPRRTDRTRTSPAPRRSRASEPISSSSSGALDVRRRDDVTVGVLRDRHEAVHLVERLLAHPDGLRDRRVTVPPERHVAHVGAHRGRASGAPPSRCRCDRP